LRKIHNEELQYLYYLPTNVLFTTQVLLTLGSRSLSITFKNSVRTSKRTAYFTITKINWLTLFKEIIAAYTDNHTRPINRERSVADG
jgi:hypothetical protein